MQTNPTPFTIKHISPQGVISLWPAAHVQAERASPEESPVLADVHPLGRPIALVTFDMGQGDGLSGSVDSGVVYVLNHQGRTVDTIHIGRMPDA